MQKNIFNTNNDFIVYDIYKNNESCTEYFFVCQNTGEEKTLDNFIILDIFKENFLTVIEEQLNTEIDLRLSLKELNKLVWSYTCDTLNVNHSFIDIFEGDVFHINTDLTNLNEEDILNLNLIAYGPSYISGKQHIYNNQDSFIIYRRYDNKRLEFINREYFSSLTYNKVIELKKEYEFKKTSKKLSELNNEAIKYICDSNHIEYKKDECNHKYKFVKRIDSDNFLLDEGMFYYSFTCSHCGETKLILNCDILDYIQKKSIEIIKCKLYSPSNERGFNFKAFDIVLDTFISKEQICESFRLILKEDYELPTLNKELILIDDNDLYSSNIVLTNTIIENKGLFSKKIIHNARFVLSKIGDDIIFTNESDLINYRGKAI